ncbi:MAG: hypothetical protein ACRDPH_05795 [Marmoricola sp.]
MAWILRLLRSHPVGAPLVVGVLALLLGLGVVLGMVLGPGSAPQQAASSTDHGHHAHDPQHRAPAVKTHVVRSRGGGFRLDAPTRLRLHRHHRAVVLTSRHKDLVVTVAPAGRGPLGRASREVVDNVAAQYSHVRATGRSHQRVHGRRARMTAGSARTPDGVRLRFLVLVVDMGRRNLAMTAFTAASTSPAQVLPLVNTVANSLQPVHRRH